MGRIGSSRGDHAAGCRLPGSGLLENRVKARDAAVFAAGCVRRQIAWGNLGATPNAIDYSLLTAWALPAVVFARFVRCGELLSFLEPR